MIWYAPIEYSQLQLIFFKYPLKSPVGIFMIQRNIINVTVNIL